MTKIPGRVGPYTIHNELGRGGMSVVYRATDTRNGRMVALKILPPEFAHNPSLVKRFVREAENAVRLRHPNIVHTYEAGQADGFNFIAMELATGGTLAERVKTLGRALTPEETASILVQVAAGLDYAHRLGFIHRDIKPSNIFFAEDGRALLADFGIAKALYADYSVYTGTGVAVGTPAYMSPEQAMGNGDLDHRSDVYSLGVVAYMLLTGRVPFEADSQPALMRKIAYDPPPPAEQFNPHILPGIAYVLNCVLAKDPRNRYASAGQFTAALTQSLFLSPQAQQSAPSPHWGGQAAANLPTPLPVGSGQPRKTPPARSRNRQISNILITSALVLAALGLVWAIWQVGSPTMDGDNAGESGGAVTVADGSSSIGSDENSAVALVETATSTPSPTATDAPTAADAATEIIAPSPTVESEAAPRVEEPMPTRPPTSTPVLRFTLTSTSTSTRTPRLTPISSPTPTSTPTPMPTPTPLLSVGSYSGIFTTNGSVNWVGQEYAAVLVVEAGESGRLDVSLDYYDSRVSVASLSENEVILLSRDQDGDEIRLVLAPDGNKLAGGWSYTSPAFSAKGRLTLVRAEGVALAPTLEPTPTLRPPTSTPVSRFTPTRTPTSTPMPVPPTPTRGAAPAAVSTPTSQPPPRPVGATTVEFIRPIDGELINTGRATFEWKTNYTLQAGEAFELLFWASTWESGRSPIGAGNQSFNGGIYRAYVDLVGWQNSPDSGGFDPGHHYWGVAVVRTNPYIKIQLLGSTYRSFYYQRPQDAPQPQPTVCVGVCD